MNYNDEDVFVYQLMDLLVCKYDYKIVNVPGGKKDVWLANEKNERFPMIRLTSQQSTTLMFEKEYLMKIKKALSLVIRCGDKPLLIFNTNKESQPYTEDGFIQVVVGNYYISDASLNTVFPGVLDHVHCVENNQNECARLVRNLENDQRRKANEANKFTWKKMPKVTFGIIMLSALVFLITTILTRGTGVDNWLSTLVCCGAYYKSMVVYGHEYWRLFTSIFFHYDVFSLLFYSLTLYYIGKQLETHYKPWQYMLIFFISAVVGNVGVLVFVENNVSMGMAGGLFGLLGAFIVYAFETKMFLNPFARLKVSQIMMMSVTSLFFAGTDTIAFLSGLICGGFIAIILSKHKMFKEFKMHFMICSIVALVALLYGGFNSTTAFPEYTKLNEQIVDEYERLGLVNHAQYVDNYFKGAYEE